MTVSSTDAFAGPFAPDGVATSFPFEFVALSASEVSVYRVNAAGKTALGGYTVDLSPDGGGTVLFSLPPGVGDPIYIYSNPDFDQQTSFANQGSFSATSVDASLDKAAIRDLRQADDINRSLRVDVGDSMPMLPSPNGRKGTLLGFNSTTGLRELLEYSVLASLIAPYQSPYAKGDPGGNVMAIGLFSAANALTIPTGADAVRTSGHTVKGVGIADYIYDATVDAAYVTAHPKTSFVSSNGRGYRLATGLSCSVDSCGALGDGVNDDQPAIAAAIATGAAVISARGADYRCGAQIIVPGGQHLLGEAGLLSNPAGGTRFIFDSSVATCVSLGGPGTEGNGLSSGLRNATVLRGAGSIPSGSVGVNVERLYNVTLENVKSEGHAKGYRFKADDSRGLGATMTRCNSGNITDAHLEIDTWAELRVSQCRFGMNGTGDSNGTCYVRVTGGSAVNAAAGPNTVTFDNCQFNLGNGKTVNNVIEFVNFTSGSVSDVGYFRFVGGCHAESFLGVLKTDSTVSLLRRIFFANSDFNSVHEFWTVDAATTLTTIGVNGCFIAGPFTLAPTHPVNAVQVTGNRISGNVTYSAGDPNSTLVSSGNTIAANLTLSGEWSHLSVDDILTGTLTNNATGTWAVRLPGTDRKTWIPAIAFDTPGTGTTYAKQQGVYEITANEVICQFEIILTAKGSGTGNASLTGLPAIIAGGNNGNSSNGSGGVANYATNMASMTGAVGFRTPSGAQADIFMWGPSGSARVTDVNFTDTTTLAGTIRYFR